MLDAQRVKQLIEIANELLTAIQSFDWDLVEHLEQQRQTIVADANRTPNPAQLPDSEAVQALLNLNRQVIENLQSKRDKFRHKNTSKAINSYKSVNSF